MPPELTARQAGDLLGVSDETIRTYAERGILPARREGLRRRVWVELGDLRAFAAEYGFRIDEELASQMTSAE